MSEYVYPGPEYAGPRSHWQPNDIEKGTVQHDFGVRDVKGRAIGAIVTLGLTEFKPWDKSCGTSWCAIAPGRWYFLHAQASRGGQGFGASQRRRYFTTAASRDAAAAKYLDGARKRATKLGA